MQAFLSAKNINDVARTAWVSPEGASSFTEAENQDCTHKWVVEESMLGSSHRYRARKSLSSRRPDFSPNSCQVAKKGQQLSKRFSCFSLWLQNLVAGSDPKIAIIDNNQHFRTETSQQIRIIMVEDDATQQMALHRMLVDKYGFCVLPVSSGEEALILLEKMYGEGGESNMPTIIILDIYLPGISGIETLQAIRYLYPEVPIPVIAITSCDDETTLHSCFKAGVNDIICKPVSPGNLISRLGAQLRILDFWTGQLEAQKHEMLLKEILPDSIIHRLNRGQRLIFDELEEVTIVFTDIVGFTTLASSIGTENLILMLDDLFTRFDDLTDRHGVYKVETIGAVLYCISVCFLLRL